jgi:hypothetical protein
MIEKNKNIKNCFIQKEMRDRNGLKLQQREIPEKDMQSWET